MGRLGGRTAVITGAASGIGMEIARTFAKEGAKVVMLDITPNGDEIAASFRLEGYWAEYAVCDVSCSEQVKKAMEIAISKTGKIDILVNCAGIADRLDVVETPEEVWDKVISINLKGVFLTMKYAIPHMLTGGGGSIVNISSLSAVSHRSSGIGDAYAASKGGVNSLTRSVAVKFARHGIRANMILPGTIVTPMNIKAYEEWDPRVPLGRLGEPSEVAQAALFLASDEASFITATPIMVDGGSHAALAPSRRRKV